MHTQCSFPTSIYHLLEYFDLYAFELSNQQLRESCEPIPTSVYVLARQKNFSLQQKQTPLASAETLCNKTIPDMLSIVIALLEQSMP